MSADWCQFCVSNGEPEKQYRSHKLRTANGLVSCPVLRTFVCPYCKATGDYAHTQSYCPLVDADNSSSPSYRLQKSATGRLPAQDSGWPIPTYQNVMKNYTGTLSSSTRPMTEPYRLPGPAVQPGLEWEIRKHQQYLKLYREKWMEHQAEINRLHALAKFRARGDQTQAQVQPSVNPRYIRTFKPNGNSPKQQEQGDFPTKMNDNPALGIMLAQLREGTVEVKMN